MYASSLQYTCTVMYVLLCVYCGRSDNLPPVVGSDLCISLPCLTYSTLTCERGACRVLLMNNTYHSCSHLILLVCIFRTCWLVLHACMWHSLYPLANSHVGVCVCMCVCLCSLHAFICICCYARVHGNGWVVKASRKQGVNLEATEKAGIAF